MNKKQKSLNNKGFSLVELIIVIAIMAVLVGALAPQYVKYLDKSRVSSDIQLADNIRQAIQVTLLDPEITSPAEPTWTDSTQTATEYKDLPSNTAGFWSEVYDILGVNDLAALKKELKLDSSNATIQYQINSNQSVSIVVIGGKYGADADNTSVSVD